MPPNFSPTTAASRTLSEGDGLGSQLLRALGAGYNQPIHFLGHSLGTIVNCEAADFIHGHAITRPPGLAVFDSKNTHMTLFDEAEAVSILDAGQLALDPNLNADTAEFFLDNPWARVIPANYAWVDNYVSLVGLAHTEAANIVLWRDASNDLNALHGYAIDWYSRTVANPTISLMGFRYSFERNSLRPPPGTNTYFFQSLDLSQSELSLIDVTTPFRDALTASAGLGLDRFLIYPTMGALKAYQVAATLGYHVEAGIQNGIQYAGSLTEKFAADFGPPSGQPVFFGAADSTPAYFVPPTPSAPGQAAWGFQFTLQPPPQGPLVHQPKGGSVTTNLFASVPVIVPEGATQLSFQFQISGAGPGEFFTMGISNQNFFTMESEFIQDSVWMPVTVVGISGYAGQGVQLFFGLNGDNVATAGQLSVRGIQFAGPLAPTLSMSTQGASVVLSWPLTAFGWQLESASSLSPTNAWTDVANPPALLGYEYVVTNSITAEATLVSLGKRG